MEMASIHLDCSDNSLKDELQPISPSSPDINDVVGTPQLNPRLGDEYQVEIPSLMTQPEQHQISMNLSHSEGGHDISDSFVVGLPSPLISVHNEVEDVGNEGSGYLRDNDSTVNVTEPSEASNAINNGVSDNGKESGSTTFQPAMAEETRSNQLGSKKHGMVPGMLTNSWSDAEVKSFLLGLFIFGKNFIQIRRFLENKGMGEILSFYYGEFYKTDGHRRWSGCRKVKGKRCLIGQKLLTGWRQQELLSRLIPHISEECQGTLLQVSKSYAEGRTSLEEYVSSLKSNVGLSVLVEAVGINKEKEDLTSLAAEPAKNNQVFSISPNVPTGQAWSSLGPSDIIKVLTGDFRLSKAKSNDLFWEAVWPRLLARGWHSEQPKNQGYVSSNCLVFLIPGVKKFSRRNLVKGDHYFDSVSGVLHKVVSEPSLLELEVEEAQAGRCNEVDRLTPEMASDDDDQSDYNRPCYLKPRVSSHNSEHMKFTVVDTSLVHGEKSSNVRELKCLPLKLNFTSKQTNQLRGKENNSYENSEGKVEVDAVSRAYKGDKHLSKANHRKDMADGVNQKLTKLTVVDTSLLHGGKLSKVRELRYPPVEIKDTSKMTGLSRESDRSFSDDSPIKIKDTVPIDVKNTINADSHKGTSERDATNQKTAHDNLDDNPNKMEKRRPNQKTDMSDDKQVKRTIKNQFSRRARSDNSNHTAPPLKRRRLTACAKAEQSRILENSSGHLGPENPALSHSMSFPDAKMKVDSSVSHQENVSLIASLAEGSVKEDNKESILRKNCLRMTISCVKVEKCELKPKINLNLSQVPPKSGNGEMLAKLKEDGQCLKPSDPCLTSDAQELVCNPSKTSSEVPQVEQQSDANPRRQSRRNRPLTLRALESLENDFLHVQRRPKKKDVHTLNDFSPCRRARSRVKTTLHRHSLGRRVPVSTEEKHLNGNSNVRENVSKHLDQTEEK